MAISTDNVTVTISVADKAVDQAGFGVPMIVGPTQAFAERSKVYSAATMLAAMVVDGFATTDPEYLAASAMLAVSPRPATLRVGRRAIANVPDLILTGNLPTTVVVGDIYTVTVDGVAFSRTAGSTVGATEAAALATLVDAVTGLAAANTTVDVSIAGDTAGTVFDIEFSKNFASVDDTTVDASVATELAAILADNSEWYGFILASHSTLENVAAAAWAETNKRQFFPVSQDTDILSDTGGNMLETLEAAAYHYTAAMFSRRPGDFPGGAWMASRYPLNPGSESWKFVGLSGITVDDLTASDISNIRTNKGNYYVQDGGQGMMSEGWASSGRFVDITRFKDWLQARISESVFGVMINAAANPGKISFTDAGINQIVSAVDSVLQTAIRLGGLAADPKPLVTAPLAADVSAANKANRHLPDIDFSGTLAGGIHNTTVTGKVTL